MFVGLLLLIKSCARYAYHTYSYKAHAALPMTFRLPMFNGEGRVRHVCTALSSNNVQDPVRSRPVQRRTGGELSFLSAQVRESVAGLW